MKTYQLTVTEKQLQVWLACECDIAFDMWRKIIRKDDFRMGSEPAITIMEIDDE